MSTQGSRGAKGPPSCPVQDCPWNQCRPGLVCINVTARASLEPVHSRLDTSSAVAINAVALEASTVD